VSCQREYKGFQVNAAAAKSPLGGYVASVTLVRQHSAHPASNKFDLPLEADLCSENDALHQAMQYGLDLIDGLVPWFDPDSIRTD
jgi:hypothetical protein